MASAIILSSIFIGLNNFFSGLIVQPQLMVRTFYAVPYYICPGHYVYDGLLASMYLRNNETVLADRGSLFERYLEDQGTCNSTVSHQTSCTGTAYEFIQFFFGNQVAVDQPAFSGVVLGAMLILARVLTWVALKYIRFS